MKKEITTILAICVFLGLCVWAITKQKNPYHYNAGHVFGTYYNIRYQTPSDLEKGILKQLEKIDKSLSIYNNQSIIYKINNNIAVTTDSLFELMYNEARSIYEKSNHAFDITVAPVVNAWGFGTGEKQMKVTPQHLDSLRMLIGMDKIQLQNHQIIKDNPAILLDANAIAKGLACDIVAEFLRKNQCKNFLIDIGGEVVTQGVNSSEQAWKIGITKPYDDITGKIQDVHAVIEVNECCMATSGNYRQFYYQDSLRRSHTVDPLTGYPVNHTLLSATVMASSCMRADAIATACMVLGVEKSLQMVEKMPDCECYLIYDSPSGLQTITSSTWQPKH